MKHIALLILVLTLAANAHAKEITGVGKAKDGDSLMVGSDEVRLVGIDAPEYKQTCEAQGRTTLCGEISAAALRGLIDGKTIRCDYKKRDKYRRILGRCFVGDADINAMMVSTGNAVAYRRYEKTYVVDETNAQHAKRGIWAGTFMKPEQWRREH